MADTLDGVRRWNCAPACCPTWDWCRRCNTLRAPAMSAATWRSTFVCKCTTRAAKMYQFEDERDAKLSAYPRIGWVTDTMLGRYILLAKRKDLAEAHRQYGPVDEMLK